LAQREARRRRALRHPARALDAISAVTRPKIGLWRDFGWVLAGPGIFVGQLFPKHSAVLGGLVGGLLEGLLERLLERPGGEKFLAGETLGRSWLDQGFLRKTTFEHY